MSDSEILVKVEGVSKKFCRSLKRSLWYGFQDIAGESFGRNGTHDALRKNEFWAVKDVSFELKRGECLGLIGRNGAGKTTLLKMLNGLIKPDHGRIEMRGRVGALIALGAGFNPILTGRENIYVNGSVLGLTKREIDAKLEDIIDFADIREFIDTPVQNYSSGMQVRLGFAVATALNPDVLILDEVLAVGDAAFRAKCYNRIGKLQKTAAVIFVSHSMQQVSQVCSSVLLLKNGKVKWSGGVPQGVAEYTNENASNSGDGERVLVMEPPVCNACLTFSPAELQYGQVLNARLDLDLAEPMLGSSIRIPFYSPEGLVVAEWNSKRAEVQINLPAGKSTLELQLGPLHFGPGAYQLAFVLNDASGVYLPFWSLKQHSFVVIGETVGSCEYQIPVVSYNCITQKSSVRELTSEVLSALREDSVSALS
jgi:lipopolysaccharide transport system ATP-binding protein